MQGLQYKGSVHLLLNVFNDGRNLLRRQLGDEARARWHFENVPARWQYVGSQALSPSVLFGFSDLGASSSF